MAERSLRVTAVSPVEMVVKEPLRFPVPGLGLASSKDGFVFWWAQLQAIFDFEDPATFPALPTAPVAEDRRILERFVAKSPDLATSTVLNSQGSVTINIADDGQSEEVVADHPPADAIAGFSAIFRQFYADEAAGFNKVSGVLMALAKAATDSSAERRVEELKKWSRAAGRLRNKSVERLVHEHLAADGRFPALPPDEASHYPDLEIPEQAISAYFYGEHLHWGDKSAILAQRAEDPVNDALFLHGFLMAAMGLSHLYIGYAALVEAALGEEDGAKQHAGE